MHGKGDLKPFMRNEMEIMNALNHRKLIRLHDSFESPHTFTLITELYPLDAIFVFIEKQVQCLMRYFLI